MTTKKLKTIKGFIHQPTRFDYLVRRYFPIGILDHYAMRRMENSTHGNISLELTREQADRLKAKPFHLDFGPSAMTDLDSNLLVIHLTLREIDYSTTLVLAPIRKDQAFSEPIKKILGKVFPGLEEPLVVDPSSLTIYD